MTDEVFEYAIKVIKDFEVHILNISGGDPFYHPKIFEWIERIHKETKVVYVIVESNGWYFLDDQHVQLINKIKEISLKL